MTDKLEEKIRTELFAMQDLKYRDFHSRLMPNISKEVIIGVRTPALRAYAKRLAKQPEAKQFLQILPHTYYEENNLHAFLLEIIKDYDECIEALDVFLPYVDNWATCDMMNPKVLKKYPRQLIHEIDRWISSKETYQIRFAIGLLMNYYLDAEFRTEYADRVARVHSEEYYVKMMAAWYFATALAKQYDAVLPYFEQLTMDVWTHNKALQKAIESYRLTPEQKVYLKTLKRK